MAKTNEDKQENQVSKQRRIEDLKHMIKEAEAAIVVYNQRLEEINQESE